MPRTAAPPSHAFLITVAILLALLHGVLALTASASKSMTADEIAHLTAGHSYNIRHDYRLQPENGNLPQRLGALPMTAGRVALPPTYLETWRTADVWNYGYTTFYQQGLPVDQWLFLGRGMIALMSSAVALLVFFWSRCLFGWRGAFVSLVLFVFCPSFLAHGAVVTSDVVMTFFFVASLGAGWCHLQRPGWKWATVSTLTLGLAFVAKFSAPLLLPMFAATAVVWAAWQARSVGWRAPTMRVLRTTLLHAVVAWAVVWAFYGFRYAAFAPEWAAGATFNHGWDAMFIGLGPPAKIIGWLREWHLLPEAWLYGLTFVLQFSRARGAFLSGEYSVTGWVEFFPFAFAVKTPLPLLVLFAAALLTVVWWGSRRHVSSGAGPLVARPMAFTPLAALFVVYWITSLTTNLNIGHRHILPIYPVLFIAAGALGRWLDRRRPVAAGCVLLLTGWHVAESQGVRPHYLAYFNQVVGGPANGWRHLVDSSLDWGQDLPALKAWLDRNNQGERVFLAYFGTGDATYEGIRATAMPTLPQVGTTRPWHRLDGGIYAISATMLQHVYSPVRGPWTIALEQEYQKLRPLEETLLDYQGNPERRAELLRETPVENWNTAWKRFEILRFARLAHYLRARGPDAYAGYSILLFRLSAAQVAAAAYGTANEWRALMEQTLAPGTP